MISSVITLPFEKPLLTLFETEQFRHPRASYSVRRDGEELVIEVRAEDATALKTAVSSICRVVTVFEKARGLL